MSAGYKPCERCGRTVQLSGRKRPVLVCFDFGDGAA